MAKKFKFSGHQTFAFRYGWLEKGVRGVAQHPDLFFRDDALVLLGVGKNMVDSIRHWCEIAQLVEPDPNPKKDSARRLQPTEIATRLLLNGAWDPFLEDDASLWLIHWLIATNPMIGTGWQLLFSHFNRPDFTRREITNYMRDFAAKKDLKVGNSVLARDVDCLIRTYLPTRPLVVRRHSFETRALRYFAVEYVDDPESLNADLAPSDADGKVLVCLAEPPVVAEQFRDLAMRQGIRSYEN